MYQPVPEKPSAAPTPAEAPEAGYATAVARVSANVSARFMVPGHKGGQTVPPAMRSAYGDAIDAVYASDLPLHIRDVDVADVGAAPLERAEEHAAVAFGAAKTLFLTNGGSQAGHIICLTARFAAGGRRPRILAQRSVHQSIVYGAMLADADVVWLTPERHRTLDIDLGVTSTALQEVIESEGRFDMVIVVCPNYFGAVADIAALAEICERYDTILAADEAWGAHFRFNERFPTPAVQAGAHLVTSSTHKAMGSLTQSAMLHVAGDAQLTTYADRARRLVKSTSLNSLLLASLDAARAYAETDGPYLLGVAADLADMTRRRINALPGLSCIDETLIDDYDSVTAFDPLRVTVDVTATGLTGFDIRDLLLADENGRIEIEFCTDELFVALFGIGDVDQTASDRLVDALERILAEQTPASDSRRRLERPRPPAAATRLRDGFFGRSKTVELELAVGETCAELVAPYPPGIAVVMPGELLTPEVVDYLLAIRRGASFSDCADPSLKTVQVLAPSNVKEF